MTTIVTERMRRSPYNDRKPAGDASGLAREHTELVPMKSRPPALLRRLLVFAITAAALLAGLGNAAQAQVSVDGRPDAVHIEARDATLREVFDALQTKFGLRYRTDDALETRKTGIFDGPLQRVTARMLDGYDFAMKVTPQGDRCAGVATKSSRRSGRRFSNAGFSAAKGFTCAGHDRRGGQSLRTRTLPLAARAFSAAAPPRSRTGTRRTGSPAALPG